MNAKKEKKRPATRIRRLSLKEAGLRRELEGTMKEIQEDTVLKRENGKSLDKMERQKLANRATIIRSKILRLQDEIETRSYVKDDKESKQVQSKIEESYFAAARKHNRLLRMTAELERLKKDEQTIRALAKDEMGWEARQEQASSSDEDVLSKKVAEHRKTLSAVSRISTTSFRHSTKDLDHNALDREGHLQEVQDSLSKLGLQTPQEKVEKADRMAFKYELKRETRNLALGQMIFRPHKNSYWRINPPYRRKPKKMERVRRAYARDFYEDRVDIVQAKDRNVTSPRKEMAKKIRKKEAEELPRFTMSCGRTISMKKMKEFTPPGMDLTPVEC